MTPPPIDDVPVCRRGSKRITVTVPHRVFGNLERASSEQGRSISNLIAFIVERYFDIAGGQQQ